MGRDDTTNDRTVIERVDPLVGAVLGGKYRLEFKLASGGFGAIYRARELASGNELAVKVVHGRLARDPGVAARFRREGETLTALRSPHTITAYEVGETPDGTLYIVLELMRGVNLFERFRTGGPLPWPRMVAIARGVCHSLAEAHALGVVHRDLKPTNIHLEHVGDDEDFVKVLDFGIAKVLQSSQLQNADLTTAGLMIGTLDYMSPEQMLGGEITAGTDIYTLGIVMYEMITGKRPFAESETAAAALAASLKTPPLLSTHVLVPAELDRIVARCLARDARDRFRSAAELSDALGRVAVSTSQLTDHTAVMPRADAIALMRAPAMDPHDMTVRTPQLTDETVVGRPQRRSAETTAVVDLREAAAQMRLRAPTPVPEFAPMTMRITVPPPAPAPPRPPPIPPAPPPPLQLPPEAPLTLPPSELVVIAPPPPPPSPSGSVPPLTLAQQLQDVPAVFHPQAPDTLRGIVAQRPPPGTVEDATTIDQGRRYEVDRVVARDSAMRRVVWIVVAVLAIAAIFAATRL